MSEHNSWKKNKNQKVLVCYPCAMCNVLQGTLLLVSAVGKYRRFVRLTSPAAIHAATILAVLWCSLPQKSNIHRDTSVTILCFSQRWFSKNRKKLFSSLSSQQTRTEKRKKKSERDTKRACNTEDMTAQLFSWSPRRD